MEKRVYLDNNATTPLHPEVKKAIIQNMDVFGNASSMHERGRSARALIEKARETTADYLGCDSDEIIFTAGGSESNNAALNILNCSKPSCGHVCKKQLITSVIEHPSVSNTARNFAKTGKEVAFLPVDSSGMVNEEDLIKTITSTTGMISIMLANNEIGTIQPVKKLAEIAHKKECVHFHTDAVQAAGKIPFNVKDLGVDMLSMSGHKIYGPKGVGLLYIKKGMDFCPLIVGGHHEQNRRAGTENSLGIIGLGKAIEMLKKEQEETIKKVWRLRNKLKEGILNSITDVQINGHETLCQPGTLNMSFQYIEGESILLMLDLEGIEVSTGSACASGSLEPSPVLLALGMPTHMAHGSIRFSLGRENTEADIDYVLEKLPPIIARLRKMSPLYKCTSHGRIR